MTNIDDNDQKELVKEAIKEWMDDRYTEVGRWFVKSLLVAAITSFLFWYIAIRGYHFP